MYLKCRVATIPVTPFFHKYGIWNWSGWLDEKSKKLQFLTRVNLEKSDVLGQIPLFKTLKNDLFLHPF